MWTSSPADDGAQLKWGVTGSDNINRRSSSAFDFYQIIRSVQPPRPLPTMAQYACSNPQADHTRAPGAAKGKGREKKMTQRLGKSWSPSSFPLFLGNVKHIH